MPGTLLVPAGLGGVAARLEVMLEEMLEVRGLPTGRMPSMSCNESEEKMELDTHGGVARSWRQGLAGQMGRVLPSSWLVPSTPSWGAGEGDVWPEDCRPLRP